MGLWYDTVLVLLTLQYYTCNTIYSNVLQMYDKYKKNIELIIVTTPCINQSLTGIIIANTQIGLCVDIAW